MGPRKFKEMLDQIPRLTPVQKQRVMHGVQTSVRCDELPEPARQREAELDRLQVCTHCGSSQGRCVTGSRQACVDFVAVRHRADAPFTR